MDRLGVNTIPDYIIKAYGNAEQALSESEKTRRIPKSMNAEKPSKKEHPFWKQQGGPLWTLAIPM